METQQVKQHLWRQKAESQHFRSRPASGLRDCQHLAVSEGGISGTTQRGGDEKIKSMMGWISREREREKKARWTDEWGVDEVESKGEVLTALQQMWNSSEQGYEGERREATAPTYDGC